LELSTLVVVAVVVEILDLQILRLAALVAVAQAETELTTRVRRVLLIPVAAVAVPDTKKPATFIGQEKRVDQALLLFVT
jgi:hypothetical protein